MRLRVEEAQKRVDSVQVGAQLERKLLKVQAESAWSMVIGKEAQRDAKAVDLQEKKKRARKTQAKLDKATDEEKIFAAELTALEADANEVKEALQPAQEELNAAIKDLKEAKVDLRGADVSRHDPPRSSGRTGPNVLVLTSRRLSSLGRAKGDEGCYRGSEKGDRRVRGRDRQGVGSSGRRPQRREAGETVRDRGEALIPPSSGYSDATLTWPSSFGNAAPDRGCQQG